jgi:hypothetical protein
MMGVAVWAVNEVLALYFVVGAWIPPSCILMGASLFVSCEFVCGFSILTRLFFLFIIILLLLMTQLHHDQGQALQGLEHLRLQDR